MKLKARIDAAEALLAPARRSPPRRLTSWSGAGGISSPYRIAAALIIAAALAIGIRARRAAPEVRTVVTGRGERVVLHLGDSSTITVGPATTLRYSLTRATRDFELDGIADFGIVHDSTRPVIVRTVHATAVDVGTRFVVRAYRGEGEVRVAVSSGAVDLSPLRASTGRVRLAAGEIGTVLAADSVATMRRGDVPSYTAWLDGRLSFDDQSLSVVAAELARWFDVEIRIASPELARRRITAVYNDPSLTNVLDALAITLGARYERAGRTVTLMPRRQRA